MKVRLRLFAVARQHAEADDLVLELGEEKTIAALRAALVAAVPALQPISSHLRFAVNSEYADDATAIIESDEVACIPPVSGG